jgi:hypothetical protein
MNSDIILSFTIILSFIGIVISICALIFSIVYLIKVSKLSGTQQDIKDTLQIIEEIKTILIAQCVVYSDTELIKGTDAIKLIQEQYTCDELTAIKIYYNVYKEKENN